MTKFLAALVVAFGFMAVTGPAQAGVVTGDFFCNPTIQVVNVVDVNGVVTGDLAVSADYVYSESVTCNNGLTLSVNAGEAGYTGVVTGD